ncbi:MAG: M48 family metalloprotease [Pseudomonadota bacterium]
MQRLFKTSALLLLPLLLLGCQDEMLGKLARNINVADTLKTANKAFGKVDQKEEKAIGREAVAVLLGAVPLLDNDPLQRYVNRVGGWVALHTERKQLGWRFGVLDSEDINAFAAPGGYIFITKGLLRRMNSEAELAGALAHETVHVLKKHHLAAVQKAARVNLAASLARTQVNEGDRSKMDKISAGFKELYSRGLDKSDEFEADRMGVVIASRAGYDPYGLPAVLQTLAGMSPDDASLAFLFKTHPPAGKRLSLLERLFNRLDPFAGQPQVSKRFHKHLALLK